MSLQSSPRRKRPCSPQDSSTTPSNDQNSSNNEEENSQSSKKPRLSGDEYIKLKQELRERKKVLSNIPRFRLKTVGENASLDVDNSLRVPLFLNDIQHLLMFSLLGPHSPQSPERWCHLEKFSKISHTVVFVVEGLSSWHFSNHESIFTHIANNLEHKMEIVTPATYGGSVIEELSAVPLSGTQTKKLITQFGSLDAAMKNTGDLVKLLKVVFPMRSQIASDGNVIDKKLHSELPESDKFPRTQLLLSPWQLVEENYPLPLRGGLAMKYRDYISTKETYLEATPKSPMFGLDCEMCRTTLGILELTRISIVNENLDVVYESFVKPKNKIVDYLTRYSGINEKILENVTTSLEDVQNVLKEILPSDGILVGQSLNADLHTLKMMHPYIIDTSVIFNLTGDRYRKSKLQVLSREFLNEIIQESKDGHCSVEDSQASMKLVQLKLKNDINFGDAVMINHREVEETINNIRKRNNNCDIDPHKYGITIFKHITRKERTASIIGKEDVIKDYSIYLKNSTLNIMDDANFDKNDQVRLVLTETNKKSVNRTCEISMEHALTFCHVKLNDNHLNDDNAEKTCKKVDKWMQKIWNHIAVNGLFCVIFGGQNNAANGACFLNIKREQLPLR